LAVWWAETVWERKAGGEENTSSSTGSSLVGWFTYNREHFLFYIGINAKRLRNQPACTPSNFYIPVNLGSLP
jgi:hypothetical protein